MIYNTGSKIFRGLMAATCAACFLTGCNDYSPDSYNASGMQQVGKVDRAVVKSFRQVNVSDPALGLGAGVGGVAGGVAGAQIGQGGGSALAAVGGALVGAAAGAVIQHEASKTTAYEYVLQKSNGDLITLAQKQDTPLAVGQHVLVLYGEQARIIPDTAK
ncbi:MAG TPA: glycine zipper 2TM domain-containing protein [Rickettsiales bacterium]|nr:glycine zipper 2TM domain-containing protein [Rickettsiales bacterium]